MTPVTNAVLSVATLVLLLGTAAACDLAAARISNRLTVSAALVGLGFSAAPHGNGFWDALGGGMLGFGVFFPLYAWRALGAGDVKLMAAAGTFLGVTATLTAAVYALALGGLVAALYAWKNRVAMQAFRSLRVFFYSGVSRLAAGSLPRADEVPISGVRAPYAIAIAGGVALQLFTRVLVQGGAV